jgi:hypothetical protein
VRYTETCRRYIIQTCNKYNVHIFYHGATAPIGPRPPLYRIFMISLRHTTLGRTSLDEWSARGSDLYLITHNIHKRQTSMSLAGFEPIIPASERSQTHALDRAATGTCWKCAFSWCNWRDVLDYVLRASDLRARASMRVQATGVFVSCVTATGQ